ncbi:MULTISPECIES: 3'-5' exonuclease [unclassified Colwellia]|uniref:3'-5' exonuclease n=1 Tax=unclassified Colwellia TaxID=196834 RepID=UPI0015F5B5CF|nr:MULTISPECIES: hypothetical protein [unclassified Colwellia]MBA6232179.1 hypothetical protein [Colwellia sp. MB02u-7]MBA6237123.1 hypothetical protein [Colwellia sp. MB02u-11]MBA6301613.1 hypothetical protein [Colwellia sp. MB3u-22]MBA6311499.1 hypothetical protein [Colwellia sp. MB3u-64]
MSHPDLSKTLYSFIDFEASSLNEENSYPISLGIVHQGKAYYWLIKPKNTWIDWDANAEKIHNISRKHLTANGIESNQVTEEIRQLLGTESILYSDNPFWEKLWLSRLGICNIQISDAYDLVFPGNEGHVEPILEAIRQKHRLTNHNAIDDAIAIALIIKQLR